MQRANTARVAPGVWVDMLLTAEADLCEHSAGAETSKYKEDTGKWYDLCA